MVQQAGEPSVNGLGTGGREGTTPATVTGGAKSDPVASAYQNALQIIAAYQEQIPGFYPPDAQNPKGVPPSATDYAEAVRSLATLGKQGPQFMQGGGYTWAVDPSTGTIIPGTKQPIDPTVAGEAQARTDLYNAQTASALATAAATSLKTKLDAETAPDVKAKLQADLATAQAQAAEAGARTQDALANAGRTNALLPGELAAQKAALAKSGADLELTKATTARTNQEIAADLPGAQAAELQSRTGQANALTAVSQQTVAGPQATAIQHFNTAKQMVDDLVASGKWTPADGKRAMDGDGTLANPGLNNILQAALQGSTPLALRTQADTEANNAATQQQAKDTLAETTARDQQTANKDFATGAQTSGQAGLNSLFEMAKAGTAPLPGVTASFFKPLNYALSVLHQGVQAGTVNPDHIPQPQAPGVSALPAQAPGMAAATAPTAPLAATPT